MWVIVSTLGCMVDGTSGDGSDDSLPAWGNVTESPSTCESPPQDTAVHTETPPSPTDSEALLEVRAFIDGRDELHVQGDRVWWEHSDLAGPGLLDGADQPTFLSTTTISGTSDVTWCPLWSDGCNTCDGSCDELRAPDLSEPDETPLGMPLPAAPQDVVLTPSACRESCAIVQQPSADNGYELVVELDDDRICGADWYEVALTYSASVTSVDDGASLDDDASLDGDMDPGTALRQGRGQGRWTGRWHGRWPRRVSHPRHPAIPRSPVRMRGVRVR